MDGADNLCKSADNLMTRTFKIIISVFAILGVYNEQAIE